MWPIVKNLHGRGAIYFFKKIKKKTFTKMELSEEINV